MSLTHSKLVAPTGNREVFRMSTAIQQRRVLAAWESEANEPQELELLVYPIFSEERSDEFDLASTFDRVWLDLELALGAGERANAVQFSTSGPIEHSANGTNFSLPSNGVRLRFVARRARLQLLQSDPIDMTLISAFSPCRGMQTQCIPNTVCCDDGPGAQRMVPKGARECRVLSSNPLAVLRFYDPAEDVRQQGPASEWAEWRPFTGHAYVFDIGLSSGDWDPAAGEAYEVQFR